MWSHGEFVKKSEVERLTEERGETFSYLVDKRKHSKELFNGLRREGLCKGERFEPLYKMLDAMSMYLAVPWVMSLRPNEENGDPISIEQNPLPVRVSHHSVSWIFNAYSFSTYSGSSDVDLQDGWKCEGDPDVESRCTEQDKRLLQHRVMSSKVLTVKERHKMIDKEVSSSTRRDTNHAMGDNLIPPVDRPDEMPLDDQTKFHDPTGTFWDIYWWKLRERLWFAADDLYWERRPQHSAASLELILNELILK